MTSSWQDKTVKHNIEVTAILIPDMAEMGDDDYRAYVRDGLVFRDHHWVLRSTPAEYPLATTNRQLEILIEELQAYTGQLNEERD